MRVTIIIFVLRQPKNVAKITIILVISIIFFSEVHANSYNKLWIYAFDKPHDVNIISTFI